MKAFKLYVFAVLVTPVFGFAHTAVRGPKACNFQNSMVVCSARNQSLMIDSNQFMTFDTPETRHIKSQFSLLVQDGDMSRLILCFDSSNTLLGIILEDSGDRNQKYLCSVVPGVDQEGPRIHLPPDGVTVTGLSDSEICTQSYYYGDK